MLLTTDRSNYLCWLGGVIGYAGGTVAEPMTSQAFLELLLKVIPLGIGSTVSPVILGVTLTLLAKKDYLRKRTTAYLAGAVLVVVILATVGSAIGTGAMTFSKSTGQTTGLLDLLVGLLLIGFGIRSAFEKPSQGTQRLPVHDTASSAQFAKWFALGFLLNITNFDAVLLNITATKEIFQAGIHVPSALLLTGICDALFLLPIILPISAYLIAPNTAEKALKPIAAASEKYGKYLLMIILLAFGIYLLWRGLGLLI